MILPEEAIKIAEKGLLQIQMAPEPAELYEPIRYILSLGGKRLRPVLTLMCCSLYSNDILKAIPAALAIEVFHNFTLLHDDIMDNAPLRRNHPTVHEKWNNNVAILSGDAMLIKAYDLTAGMDQTLLPVVLPVFNQTALEVCEGQQFDMNFENRSEVSEEEYLRMIELKTAVLIAAAMKIGAICGGAGKEEADFLYEAGRCLGLAFQLQDDWLDTFGNVTSLGKQIGGDIKANKKTWLYIKALELATPSDKKNLLETFSSEADNAQEKVDRVKEIFIRCQVDKLASSLVCYYSEKAFTALQKSKISSNELAVFNQMFSDLTGRKS